MPNPLKSKTMKAKMSFKMPKDKRTSSLSCTGSMFSIRKAAIMETLKTHKKCRWITTQTHFSIGNPTQRSLVIIKIMVSCNRLKYTTLTNKKA